MAHPAPDLADLYPPAAPLAAEPARPPHRVVHIHASGGTRVGPAGIMTRILAFRRRCIRSGEFADPEPGPDEESDSGSDSDAESGDEGARSPRGPPPRGAIEAAADLPATLAGREDDAWAAAAFFGWAFADERVITATDVRELLAELDYPTRALVYRWFELLAAELAACPALAAAPQKDLFQLVALGREWCTFAADGGESLKYLQGRFQAVDLAAELRP